MFICAINLYEHRKYARAPVGVQGRERERERLPQYTCLRRTRFMSASLHSWIHNASYPKQITKNRRTYSSNRTSIARQFLGYNKIKNKKLKSKRVRTERGRVQCDVCTGTVFT